MLRRMLSVQDDRQGIPVRIKFQQINAKISPINQNVSFSFSVIDKQLPSVRQTENAEMSRRLGILRTKAGEMHGFLIGSEKRS